MSVALSVLVPTVHTRRSSFFPKIAEQLYGQLEQLPSADQQRVEILALMDNRQMTLGSKRNAMVELSHGRYVVHVDDDDRVADDYLATLLAAIDDNPGVDVVVFDVQVSINGGRAKRCRYSREFPADVNTTQEYRRLPNHLMPTRRDLVLAVPFEAKPYGEDSAYSAALRPLLKTEHRIARTLYWYDYDQSTTAAQAVADPSAPPIVDVVILSKAPTFKLRGQTQRAIDTCRVGAKGFGVNVIVMEQDPEATYRNASVIRNPGPFHYNRSANTGAAAGSAPWVMVANADLVFEAGWLAALLRADHPVVSPLNPGDYRQRRLAAPESGYVNGRHFSGWCFMVRRELWEQLGGFDERVSFYCSDDVVIEQLRAVDTPPMVVPAARVRHMAGGNGSQPDDLTWGQVVIFNELYPERAKFVDDPRLVAYCERVGAAEVVHERV